MLPHPCNELQPGLSAGTRHGQMGLGAGTQWHSSLWALIGHNCPDKPHLPPCATPPPSPPLV